ncbi:MAG: SDR family oxidoreductase [Gammaproteobacteria bacterium]|nr:MAG: SDR family oxidoreductase [Gammaproteobacteria bacterium]
MNSQSLSKEQVLIVGCGDIGLRLAQRLPQDSYEVTGLRRRPPEDTSFLRYQMCDVTDASQLAKALRKEYAAIVISMTPCERSDAGYQQAYVQTCQNLLDGLRASQNSAFLIFVSSTAVYGQMNGEWVDENSATEPDSFSGKRLLEAEAIIRESEFLSAVVRFSGIYGPGRNRLIEQVRQAKASASTHITNRIHSDDCAACLAHLIKLKRNGEQLEPIYLASDSSPTPMLEVVTWLATQMRVKDFLSPDAVNERGNKRCSNRQLLDSGFVFRYPTFKEGYAQVLADLNN